MGAIRLFLALVVAIDHLRAIILKPAGIEAFPEYFKFGMNAGFAVMYFYMISGFLISTSLNGKYEPTAAGTIAFYQNRFIRIFSLYWPMLLVLFLSFGEIAGWFMSLSIADKMTNLFILGMDWRILFADYPDFHWDASPTFIKQAWTLAPELTFYLAAPFLLRSRNAFFAALAMSIATRIGLVMTFGFDNRWTYHFLPATFVFFLMGHVARMVAMHWPDFNSPRPAFALLTVSASSLCVGSYADWDSMRFWVSAIFFALALPGIFAATKNNTLLNALGDLSYPVYLVHGILIGKIGEYAILNMFPKSGPIISAAYFVAVIVLAFATHWLLEKPTSVAMRWCIRLFPTVRRSPTAAIVDVVKS